MAVEREKLGVNGEGLMARAALRTLTQPADRATFLSRYTAPALHIQVDKKAADREPPGATVASYQRTRHSLTAPTVLARYDDQVALLLPRPGNPFPTILSVGRAENCDIVVRVASVSKLHALLTARDGTWFLCDKRSSYHTYYKGKPLAPGEELPLADWDAIQFGPEIRASFLTPESLFYIVHPS